MLDIRADRTLSDKLEIIRHISNTLMAVEKQGYILLDISPDNILYINQPFLKQAMLFDLDSLVSEDELEKIDGSMLRYHVRYRSPQLSELEKRPWNFDDDKYIYIDRALNSHTLSLMMYEFLFRELPSVLSQKKLFGKAKLPELAEKFADLYGISNSLSQEIITFISGMLSAVEMDRPCTDCGSFSEKIGQFIESINSELKERTVDEDYCRYMVYSMLEKYPLCEHIYEDGSGKKYMEISLIGRHVLSDVFFKAVFSICQMYDTRLVINIAADGEFSRWDRLCALNPELLKTVILYKNDEPVKTDFDAGIVSRPLAEIRLYDDIEGFICKKEKTHNGKEYFVCLMDGEDAVNYGVDLSADDLDNTAAADKNNVFVVKRLYEISKDFRILYIQNHIKEDTFANDSVDYISLRELYADFTEKLYRSNIFVKGFEVHKWYSKKGNPLATDEEMAADYRSNTYYAWSSVRLAMCAAYRRHDFEHGVDIDRLSAVEHLSWTAYVISHGAVALKNDDEMQNYAYYGNNDWKNVVDADHIVHPCIVSGDESRNLRDVTWDKVDEICDLQGEGKNNVDNAGDLCGSENGLAGLDGLDRRSIAIYRIIEQRANENLPIILNYVSILKFLCGTIDSVNNLEALSKELPESRESFKECLSIIEETLAGKGTAAYQANQVIVDIKNLMRPIYDLSRELDIKQPDEDLIRYLISSDNFSDLP